MINCGVYTCINAYNMYQLRNRDFRLGNGNSAGDPLPDIFQDELFDYDLRQVEEFRRHYSTFLNELRQLVPSDD